VYAGVEMLTEVADMSVRRLENLASRSAKTKSSGVVCLMCCAPVVLGSLLRCIAMRRGP
jgi:hypothetical protein